jgi:hypothetical protein
MVWPLCWMGAAAEAAFTVRPARDGTLVDGGIYGAFDGVPDDADWVFNQSGYEGSITLTTTTPSSSLEHRVVWEYNLATVTLTPPVSAKLYFKLRGAPVFPRPPAPVNVYSYPSDLVERLDDFYLGPAVLQGAVSVPAFQPPTLYSIDVSAVVDAALATGADRVAFRFQIDSATTHPENQAFNDALDAEPETKPYLTID